MYLYSLRTKWLHKFLIGEHVKTELFYDSVWGEMLNIWQITRDFHLSEHKM